MAASARRAAALLHPRAAPSSPAAAAEAPPPPPLSALASTCDIGVVALAKRIHMAEDFDVESMFPPVTTQRASLQGSVCGRPACAAAAAACRALRHRFVIATWCCERGGERCCVIVNAAQQCCPCYYCRLLRGDTSPEMRVGGVDFLFAFVFSSIFFSAIKILWRPQSSIFCLPLRLWQ